jgi:hypothetical protein
MVTTTNSKVNSYGNITDYEYRRHDEKLNYSAGYTVSQIKGLKGTMYSVFFYGISKGQYLYKHFIHVNAMNARDAWKKASSAHRGINEKIAHISL